MNHADALGLSRHAASPWLLRLYGIDLPPVESAFLSGDILFATSSQLFFADGEKLADNVAPLVGAVSLDGSIVIATDNEFLVTTADGVLIERFEPELRYPMQGLGRSDQYVVVKFAEGVAKFDPARMSVSAPADIALHSVSWSLPTTPDAENSKQIGTAALGEAINWARVISDLHSGRLLPTVGRFIADIAALCLIYLCLSGLVLWTRRR